MAGFLDVILRGFVLCGQAIALGGVIWTLLLLRPAVATRPALAALRPRCLKATQAGALIVAGGQFLALVVESVVLADAGATLAAIVATTYFQTSIVRIGAGIVLLAGVAVVRRRGDGAAGWLTTIAGAAGLLACAAWTSHAAARMGPRAVLLTLDALHQLAASVWVGGLVQLVVAAWRRGATPWPVELLRRFSTVALVSVGVLLTAGLGLSVAYVDSWSALLGTSYGLMLFTKAGILAGLFLLGGMNFLIVRGLAPGTDVGPTRLRRFVEVEFGLGATVLFAAASLTSLPPAVDIVADRATYAETLQRITPRPPRLTSPSIAEMPVDDPEAPRTDEDRAWSEFNHNVAGLFVLAMGLLAVLHATGRAGWARHWPLLFIPLTAMLLVRDDPGDWPLGPRGFWAGMLVAEVLQHRVFLTLAVVFSVFEWMVRVGRLSAPRWALVFPLLCAVGGALLLTHSHGTTDLKEEFLVEITHAPLGLLGMLVGWGRWLELRLPPGEERLPRWLWSGALAAVGVLLILYRET